MKRIGILMTALCCILFLVGCSAQETAADDLIAALKEQGFSVNVTESVPLEEAGPDLGAYRVDLLEIGEDKASLYFFKSGEELVEGMAAWRDIVATALLSGVPSLYYTDSMLLITIGASEELLDALDGLWQPV